MACIHVSPTYQFTNSDVHFKIKQSKIRRKTKDTNPIDWEQRRYEIAKEIFTRCLSSSDDDMRAFCARELETHASDCVREANALIKALKATPIEQ